MSNTAPFAITFHIAFARVDDDDAKRNHVTTAAPIEGWRGTERVDKGDGAGERCANVTFPGSPLSELSESSLHRDHGGFPVSLSPAHT